MALKNDGTVWTWGDNEYGQLGRSGITYCESPYCIGTLGDIGNIPQSFTKTQAVTGNSGDIFLLAVSAQNISQIENRLFMLEFDATEIEISDLIGYTYESETASGTYGRLQIVEKSDNYVKFKLSDVNSSDRCFSGLVNIFKMKFKPDFDGTANITVSF